MAVFAHYMGKTMDFGLTPPAYYVALGFAAYAIIHIGLALAMGGRRQEMVRIGESILADTKVSQDGKEAINHLLDTCMSFKVGLLVPIAAGAALFDILLGTPHKPDEFENDARFHRLLRLFFCSVLAANPIFAMLSVPIMLIGLVASLFCAEPEKSGTGRFTSVLESPMLRASAAVA